MKFTVESFQREAANCCCAEDADKLSLVWLRLLCTDMGQDGDRAHKLLEVISDLLEI